MRGTILLNGIGLMAVFAALAGATSTAAPALVPLQSGVRAEQLHAALTARGRFMPAEASALAVDACAMEKVVGRDIVSELKSLVPAVRFVPCNSAAGSSDDTVLWKLSGAMEWYGGRTVMLAVDVERNNGRVVHRERYTIDDGRTTEIVLSHYGVFN